MWCQQYFYPMSKFLLLRSGFLVLVMIRHGSTVENFHGDWIKFSEKEGLMVPRNVGFHAVQPPDGTASDREPYCALCRGQLRCDGTRAENIFRLSAKRTSLFKSAWGGRQFSRLLAAEVCASAVVMLDTPCSEVVWRVLATHSISQLPFLDPSLASRCAITFQL